MGTTFFFVRLNLFPSSPLPSSFDSGRGRSAEIVLEHTVARHVTSYTVQLAYSMIGVERISMASVPQVGLL